MVSQDVALNLAHGLYTKGSNPPLVLAVAGDFERLDGGRELSLRA